MLKLAWVVETAVVSSAWGRKLTRADDIDTSSPESAIAASSVMASAPGTR